MVSSIFSELVNICRTEPGLRMAVLFGSMARGDADSTSDVDILVAFADEEPFAVDRLITRLHCATGCNIDIARLDRVEATAPLLLSCAVDDGRVIVDWDGLWTEVLTRRTSIEIRAQRSYREQMAEAAQAISELTSPEQWRTAAELDARILTETAPDPELADLAEHAAESPLDIA